MEELLFADHFRQEVHQQRVRNLAAQLQRVQNLVGQVNQGKITKEVIIPPPPYRQLFRKAIEEGSGDEVVQNTGGRDGGEEAVVEDTGGQEGCEQAVVEDTDGQEGGEQAVVEDTDGRDGCEQAVVEDTDGRDGCEQAVVEDTDGQTKEEEEELDWMEEGESEREEITPTQRTCKKCQSCITQESSVDCQKCHRAVYCCMKCRRTDRSRHSGECSKHVNFKMVENALKDEFERAELTLGKRFGSFKDVPGAECEFLGGSKTTVVVKLGQRLDRNVFLCQDIDGIRTKIKFEGLDGVMKTHGEVFILISGASFQNLLPSSQTDQDIGIVDNRNDDWFYYTSVRDKTIILVIPKNLLSQL